MKHSFKVGDKVKVIGRCYTMCHHFSEGTIGEITQIINNNSQHSIRVDPEKGVSWYVNPDEIELVSSADVENKNVKVGDNVRPNNDGHDISKEMEYTVIEVGYGCVWIRDDDGDRNWIDHGKYEIVSSVHDKPKSGKIPHKKSNSPHENATVQSMQELKKLSIWQKAKLSKEEKALVKLGVVDNSMEIKDTDYALRALFQDQKIRDIIAAKAVKDVAEIEAQQKKRK